MSKFTARIAAHLTTWAASRMEEARKDRGDISITTVIIWVAAVAGALAIAGTIGVIITKYNGNLSKI